MLLLPFNVLWYFLRGLLSLALLGIAIYLLVEWNNHRVVEHREAVTVPAERAPGQGDAPQPPAETREVVRVEHWHFGWNRETAYLLGGLALLGWSFGGGLLLYPRLFRRPEPNGPHEQNDGDVHFLRRPDGTELCVRMYGPANGPPLVFIHGWSLTGDEWFYARRHFGDRYRLIIWDLPGLGRSGKPVSRDWSLEKLAADLDEVLTLANGPAVLVGHSIGGMIILTYCKLFRPALGPRVCGLVLVHTTYTNPVKTNSWAPFYTAIQKPVLEPLCYVMIALSPLLRLNNWLSYLNGSAHRSNEQSSFSGHETRPQLDFVTRLSSKASPAVLARGFLGMFRYDATDVLSDVDVPTLVVAAEQDQCCLPEASRYMADHIPGARLVTLSPARHCGLFEKHDQFHAALAEFLTDNVPSGGSRDLPARTERRGQSAQR